MKEDAMKKHEEWIEKHQYWLQFGPTGAKIGNPVLDPKEVSAYLSTLVVHNSGKEGYKIEHGSAEYSEIIVTAPDGKQQAFWPEDAAYKIIQSMLTGNKA